MLRLPAVTRRSLGAACAAGAALAAAGALPAQGRPAARAAAAERPVWPDEGPRTWAPRPTSPAITANDLRTWLYQLSADSMAGRRAGEPGNVAATDFVAGVFRRLGLRPAGDGGTYFQSLPYGPIGFDSASARLVVAGAPLAPRAEWIPTAPSAANGVGGTASFADLPTAYAGTWGDTTVALDPAVFRGKVAVFLAPPTTGAAARGPAPLPRCDSVPDRFGADAAITVEAAQRAAGPGAAGGRPAGGGTPRDLRAQAAGAAAVLVVGLDAMPRATADAAFRSRLAMRPADAAGAAGLPAATISAAAASRIFGRPLDGLAVGTAGQPVSGSWRHEWRMSPAPARNVVAMLPGSDPARAGQYVLVSAHNDHVGVTAPVDHDSLRAVNTVTRRQGANDPVCRPTAEQQRRIDSLIAHARSIRAPRLDSIMNGADDDGSGTAVLLELAERFARERPARSIIFMSHTGEEAGLLGSRWFTEHPTVPLDSVVAVLNMDMVGKGRTEQVKFGGPNSVQILGARRLSREFGGVIDSVNAVREETMAIDRSWDVPANPMNRFCRSDQVYYVLRDIPTAYFSLGYAQDYHQATDEPQYVDYDHSARLGRFLHDLMTALADRQTRPAISGADPSYPRCR